MTFRKIIASLTSVIFILSTQLAIQGSADEQLMGDLNKDKKISLTDIALLTNSVLSGAKLDESALPLADLNADKSLDSIDILLLKQIIMGIYDPNSSPVVINEICASNSEGITDNSGDFTDWIELYNTSDRAVNLKDFGLSDSETNLFEWVFPDVTIEPKSYLLIHASGKEMTNDGELHASFKVSKSGETIYLTNPLGRVVNQVEVPVIEPNTTFGRYLNGGNDFENLTPTPNGSNDLATVIPAKKVITSPVFSQESGFYNDGFSLSITADPSTRIYYTTDSSTPDENSNLYTGLVSIYNVDNNQNVYSNMENISVVDKYLPKKNVDKANVIRAVAIDSEGNTSEIISKTYFIDRDFDQKYTNTPIISVITDPENLFNYETGIYTIGKVYDDWYAETNPLAEDPKFVPDGSCPANYNQRGSEWERPAQIELFEGDRSLGLSQNVGMRIMGGWSRAANQKSLRFYAREEYGDTKVRYDLLPNAVSELDGSEITTFDKFIIRNGGNDTYVNKYRDAYIQSLVTDREFSTQATRPAVAFINGEYWGIYTITENYDDDYINDHYGVPKDEAIIVKVGEVDEGKESDIALYRELIDFATNNDLSIQENYNRISKMMDMQSFIDYYCTEIYIDNQDWPPNNYRLWRSRTVTDEPYQDGKWRWMLYDTEFSMDLYKDCKTYNTNSLKNAKTDKYADNEVTEHTILFYKLLQNEEFVERFTLTFMDITNVNFEPTSASKKLDEISSKYIPLITDHYNRFGPDWILKYFNQPATYSYNQVNCLKSYLTNRYNYVPEMLRSELNLTGNAIPIKFEVNNKDKGTIQVNTTFPNMESGSWQGKYFQDYEITVTAHPKDGCTFTGWSNGETSETITIKPNWGVSIKANFE